MTLLVELGVTVGDDHSASSVGSHGMERRNCDFGGVGRRDVEECDAAEVGRRKLEARDCDADGMGKR